MTTTTPPVTAQEPRAPGRRRRARPSEGAREERRLGWLLCAPAVIVMLAVTAYPIGYAVYLSLQRYILSAPQLN
jgi:multiple sugar transport system permease protein